MYSDVLSKYCPDKEVVNVDSLADGLVMLSEQKVDAVLGMLSSASYLNGGATPVSSEDRLPAL